MLPKSAATFGTCTHTTAEYSNKQKIQKGREPKLSVLQDVFHETFKEKRRKTWWEKDEKPEKIEEEGVYKIVPLYHEKVGKRVEPLYVEESFKVEIPGCNAFVTGTMDLVETNHVIRDLKTKGRKPHWTETLKSFQGKSYRVGYKAKFGKECKGFMLDNLIRKKEPEHIPTKIIKPCQLDQEEFLQTAKGIVESIRKGLFYPRREGNYFCSPNACGFWDICTKGSWKDPGVFTKVFGRNEAEDDSGGED